MSLDDKLAGVRRISVMTPLGAALADGRMVGTSTHEAVLTVSAEHAAEVSDLPEEWLDRDRVARVYDRTSARVWAVARQGDRLHALPVAILPREDEPA